MGEPRTSSDQREPENLEGSKQPPTAARPENAPHGDAEEGDLAYIER